ncbi:MAG: hypothetical protein H5T99_07050 [Moorella sp. (in: Bacteria)]|nr:hypothetical protein [Moorella sp. (in: firmicutes)]
MKTLQAEGGDGGPCWALLFEKDQRPAVAAWCQEDGRTVTVRLPIPRGRYHVTDWLGQDKGVLEVTSQPLAMEVTDSPTYLVAE